MSLHLGKSEDYENRMWILVDTGATIDTSNLLYHALVMSQCPEMVDKCLPCGKDIDYDVVRLLTSLDLNKATTDVYHVQIDAVIR